MQTYKNSKDNLKKENKVERLALLDIKIYYKDSTENSHSQFNGLH